MALLGRSKKEPRIEPTAEIQPSPLRLSVLRLLELLATAVAPQGMRAAFPQKILTKSLKDSLALMTDAQLADGVYAMAKYSSELVQMISQSDRERIARENGGSRQS